MTNNLNDLMKAMEKYKGSGGGGFFSLADDKDTAVVRFLHTDGNDLDWYVVHEAMINGKKRHVKCTQEANCPLCQSGNKPRVKLFLQLLVKGESEVKIWERGQKFIPQILGFINKYGDLNTRDYEIERHGKKGDTQTTYQLYPLDKEPKEIPERQVLTGPNSLVISVGLEEMRQIAQGTYVPPTSGGSTGGSTPPPPPTGRRQSVNPEDTF